MKDSTISECDCQPSGCHMNDNSESNDDHISSLDVESTNGKTYHPLRKQLVAADHALKNSHTLL